MPLSWNEIRHNAIRFSKEWSGVKRESAEKQTFWNEFFAIFGLRRRTVASFEEPVKRITGDYGYIDLFWPGTLIVEHKTAGKDLSQAESQALRYIQDLARDPARQKDIPRYIIVSDFNRIALHDLEPDDRPAEKRLPLFDQRRLSLISAPNSPSPISIATSKAPAIHLQNRTKLQCLPKLATNHADVLEIPELPL